MNISIKYPENIPQQEAANPLPLIEIFKTTGMLVFKKPLDTGINDVEIPIYLNSGIYIVELLSGSSTIATNKLVVIH
jgi:hypothetical protein